jgi:hypothetical protein
MPDYVPVYQGAKPYPANASATILGGQLVEATTTGSVGPAGLNSVKVVGVAAHDAGAGQRVTVHPIAGNVHESTHPAGGSTGDVMTAAASGNVASTAAGTAAAAGTDLGVALSTAAAGAKIRWIGR